MDRVSSRRMFGGIGLYCGTRLFGIVFKGEVYVRADEAMRRPLAKSGAGPFRPYRGRTVTSYWGVPAAVLGDKRRLRALARRAITASEEAARRTPGGRVPARRAAPRKLTLRPRRPPRS
jgi:DNA transformation protein